MQRFIGKKIIRKYVRPTCNSNIPHKVENREINNEEIIDNKIMSEKTDKINDVLDASKMPKRKVKVEKKDKGLYERTEESAILITEDNKMLLND